MSISILYQKKEEPKKMFQGGNYKTVEEAIKLREKIIKRRLVFTQAKWAKKFFNSEVKNKVSNATLSFNVIVIPERDMNKIKFSRRVESRIRTNEIMENINNGSTTEQIVKT